MGTILDYILHLDVHLNLLIASLGMWVYVVLFLVIFCETGLVVTPFLPGDSLLFTIGAICALGSLNLAIIIPLLMIAANSGDLINYFFGYKLGERFLSSDKSRFLNRKYLDRTHAFYEKYGGKTIVFARFVPIVRTFAPFVAGIGKMKFSRFVGYSVGGGACWVISFTCLGFWFGNKEVVKNNFIFVIIGIIVISVLPAVIEYFKHQRSIKALSN